jgi:integrase
MQSLANSSHNGRYLKKITTKDKNMTTKLSSLMIKNAIPKEEEGVLKDTRYVDGGGLYLLVTATGGKLWRYNFSFQNKKYTLPLGRYPLISLKQARELHNEAKNQIAKGINPIEAKRNAKEDKKRKEINTFKEVANEFMEKQKSKLAPTTLQKYINALNRDFYPVLGSRAIEDIEKVDLVRIAQRIQERGALETAHRLLNLCNQLWRYALQLDKVKHNIVLDISKQDALKPFKKSQYKTITEPQRIGELLRAIDDYKGEYTTKAILRLLPHVVVRSQSIRLATWEQIDLKNGVWVIPSENLKLKKEFKGHREHDQVLPLTPQAIKILEDIYPYTKDATYVFCSPLSATRPLSDVTLSKALKRLDFGSEIVPHGFRAMFSTLAYESGKFRGEVIEAILSHKDRNEVRRAYNRANYEEEKRELLMWWSAFLEGVKHEKK